MMKISILVLTLLLTACGEAVHINNESNPIVDSCLRKQYFDDCLSKIPTGPVSTVSNDWSEVVESCGDIARQMSYRETKNVKSECRTGYN